MSTPIPMSRSGSAARSAAQAAHPGTPIGLIDVDCEPFGSMGSFSCDVYIELPFLTIDFICDVGINPSGVQYITCRDR
jgi:hypothetical protein